MNFRAATSTNLHTQAAQVTVPASVQGGDQLLLFVSTGSDVTITPPAGWSLVGTQLVAPLRSSVFTETASSGSPGSTVNVAFGSAVIADVSLAAYSDAGPVTVAASAVPTKSVKPHRLGRRAGRE